MSVCGVQPFAGEPVVGEADAAYVPGAHAAHVTSVVAVDGAAVIAGTLGTLCRIRPRSKP